jgi:hypothetical protein
MGHGAVGIIGLIAVILLLALLGSRLWASGCRRGGRC